MSSAPPGYGSIRDFNRDRVLRAVADGRASDRVGVGRVTGLARSTVTAAVTDLLAAGLLVEDADPLRLGGPAGRPGRPARRLRTGDRGRLAIAVDFGHSHCRIGVLDTNGTIVLVRSAVLDVDASPAAAMSHAIGRLTEVLDDLGPDRERVAGATIGLPAPVQPERGTVGAGNVLPKWVNRHPAAELQAALGLPVAVENDANLGALGEIAHGAARGFVDVVYVKAAAGVGAGLVLGGRLYRGSAGMAGEIGHVAMDGSGPLCRCGNRGCLESFASVNQVLRTVQAAHPGVRNMSGLVELVESGDTGAYRVVADAGRQLGRVLADLVNNLNPQIVVLGGELATAATPLLDGVTDSLHRFARPGVVRDLWVRVGTLGENAQLIGAAAATFAAVRQSSHWQLSHRGDLNP